MSKGIYVVANKRSESECLNLVKSIRLSGCALPVTLIPYGGVTVDNQELLALVLVRDFSSFPKEASQLLDQLQEVFPKMPKGLLARFAAWFGDWDEFIYSDNDIVALTNWEKLFEIAPEADLLHADNEYTTGGKYNFRDVKAATDLLGDAAIEKALTAGHFLCRRREGMAADLFETVDWFRVNGKCTLMHDQVFLLVAAILHEWKMENLCKPPRNWLSSWAGHYKTSLELLQNVANGKNISHLHYSGGFSRLLDPIEELTLSHLSPRKRLSELFWAALGHQTGWYWMGGLWAKIRRRWKS